ncbi:hypothetical protein [Spirosoma gilvum]
MLTFCIITIAIVAVGVLSYFSSAWYGLKSSNLGKLPPHYAHLRQKLKADSKAKELEKLFRN